MMQNDLEITSKSQFGTQNMENSTKPLHSDMSGRSAGSWGTMEVWILNIFYGMKNLPGDDKFLDPEHAKFDQNPSFGHVRAVGGIMGYSGSVNFKHLLRYVLFFAYLDVFCADLVGNVCLQALLSTIISAKTFFVTERWCRRRCLKFTLPLYPVIPPTARTCSNEGFWSSVACFGSKADFLK